MQWIILCILELFAKYTRGDNKQMQQQWNLDAWPIMLSYWISGTLLMDRFYIQIVCVWSVTKLYSAFESKLFLFFNFQTLINKEL